MRARRRYEPRWGSRPLPRTAVQNPPTGLAWDGATMYQSIDGLASAIAASQQWTISYWVRHPGPTATGQNLWNINTSAGGNVSNQTFLGATNYIAVFAGTSWVTSGRFLNTNVLDGAWHHVMVSVDHAANRLDMWVDGQHEQGSGGTIWPAVSATDLVTWGAEWDSPGPTVGNWWGGDSLWIAVWPEQLDLSELAPRLYNGGIPLDLRYVDPAYRPPHWYVHGALGFDQIDVDQFGDVDGVAHNVSAGDLTGTGLR